MASASKAQTQIMRLALWRTSRPAVFSEASIPSAAHVTLGLANCAFPPAARGGSSRVRHSRFQKPGARYPQGRCARQSSKRTPPHRAFTLSRAGQNAGQAGGSDERRRRGAMPCSLALGWLEAGSVIGRVSDRLARCRARGGGLPLETDRARETRSSPAGILDRGRRIQATDGMHVHQIIYPAGRQPTNIRALVLVLVRSPEPSSTPVHLQPRARLAQMVLRTRAAGWLAVRGSSTKLISPSPALV